MATLKHIASKNSDYTAIEAYLIYQHDEFTGKQLLDQQGRPMLRDSYILDTLECGDFSFATACLLANRKYNKNNHPDDIKSHQYIISFDPRDAADNGLTMEKAQALGLNFCKANFPGHPAIVCTHPDGHNHSGNIHVHIVINSLRIYEVPLLPYMDRPADTREGCKHRCTNVAAAMPKVGDVPIPVNTAQVINDKKVSDHHAVIPTANFKETALTGLPTGERAVLELAALRLLCAVAQPHEYTETAVTLECAGHSFSTKGRTVTSPGWRALTEAYHSGKGENESSDAAKAPRCLLP